MLLRARHFILLLMLPTPAVLAGDIIGAYGYQLGMPVSEVSVLSTREFADEGVLHEVQAIDGSEVESVLLGTGVDGQHVARIIGQGRSIAAVECHALFEDTVRQLRERYPDSSYYAMDDNDMIFQKGRSIILGCKATADGQRLIVEYRDEKLLQ